jgi:hypothetical protein
MAIPIAKDGNRRPVAGTASHQVNAFARESGAPADASAFDIEQDRPLSD